MFTVKHTCVSFVPGTVLAGHEGNQEKYSSCPWGQLQKQGCHLGTTGRVGQCTKEGASGGWEGHGGRQSFEPEAKKMNKHLPGRRGGEKRALVAGLLCGCEHPMCFPLSWHFSFSASFSLARSPAGQKLFYLISEETPHRSASRGGKNSSSQKHDKTNTRAAHLSLDWWRIWGTSK